MICDSPALYRACNARPCSRDAGGIWKSNRKYLSLKPAPGGSDAKAALKHALDIERKGKQPACTCEAKVHLDR